VITQIILFLHYSPFYILVYDDPTAEDGLFIFFLNLECSDCGWRKEKEIEHHFTRYRFSFIFVQL